MFLLVFRAQFRGLMFVWQLFCFISLQAHTRERHVSPCPLHVMCLWLWSRTALRGGWVLCPSLRIPRDCQGPQCISAPKLGSLLLVPLVQLCRHAYAQCHVSLIPSSPGVLQGTHEANFASHCSIWTGQECPGDCRVSAWRWEKVSGWKEKIFSLTWSIITHSNIFFFPDFLFYFLALLGPESRLQTRWRLICPGWSFHCPLVPAQ